MTDAVLFEPTPRGDVVRLIELDLDRHDVILELLNPTRSVVHYPLPAISTALVFRADPVAGSLMNLPISLLAYGAGRPQFHAIRGPVLVLGLTADGDLTDVPDVLLSLFDTDLAT